MGGTPAFSVAIMSDLTTRILIPVETWAAEEKELLIENKSWLKQRES